jgi:hypothetical protein
MNLMFQWPLGEAGYADIPALTIGGYVITINGQPMIELNPPLGSDPVTPGSITINSGTLTINGLSLDYGHTFWTPVPNPNAI